MQLSKFPTVVCQPILEISGKNKNSFQLQSFDNEKESLFFGILLSVQMVPAGFSIATVFFNYTVKIS